LMRCSMALFMSPPFASGNTSGWKAKPVPQRSAPNTRFSTRFFTGFSGWLTRAVIRYWVSKKGSGAFFREATWKKAPDPFLLELVFCEVIAERALADAHQIGGVFLHPAG